MLGATLPLIHAHARDRDRNRNQDLNREHDYYHEVAHFALVATIASVRRVCRGCSFETQLSTLP